MDDEFEQDFTTTADDTTADDTTAGDRIVGGQDVKNPNPWYGYMEVNIM